MGLFDYPLKKVSKYLIQRSHRWQGKSPLRSLGLWGLKVNKYGHITIDTADTIDLIEQYGSPLLVVNQKNLIKDAQTAINAFRRAPVGSKILYSYKTNCIPGILRQIHNFGIGAEVISPYELWLAEQLNVQGDMIVYNGVSKSEESIRRAIEKG